MYYINSIILFIVYVFTKSTTSFRSQHSATKHSNRRFPSHSTSWGYDTTDNNGEAVEQWADSCDLTLIHDAKLPKSFNSARWTKGHNPDLVVVSTYSLDPCLWRESDHPAFGSPSGQQLHHSSGVCPQTRGDSVVRM